MAAVEDQATLAVREAQSAGRKPSRQDPASVARAWVTAARDEALLQEYVLSYLKGLGGAVSADAKLSAGVETITRLAAAAAAAARSE